MNIAIFINDITRMAGTERAVCNLANILSESIDKKIFIFSLYSQEGTPAYHVQSNVRIVHMGFSYPRGSALALIKCICIFNSVSKTLKKENIDIVLGTTHASNLLILPFLSRKIKKIACEHLPYNSCSFTRKTLRAVLYQLLDAVVLLTKEDSHHYCFLSKKKIFIIPNSLSFWNDQSASLINKNMLLIGRFSYEKGFDIFLPIAAVIKKKLPDWHINIYGSGEDYHSLLKQASELGISDYVSFHSPSNDIQNVYKNSSLYLMTSRFEGLPMVLLEAQSCGIPIISFDCPVGPRQIIHNNEDGFLIPMGDDEKFIEAVFKLATNHEMRTHFGFQAKKNSQIYSPDNIANHWNKLFNGLLKKG